MHNQNERRCCNERNSGEIFLRVIRHFWKYARRDRVCNRHRKQRITVGRCLDDEFRAYKTAGACTVIDDHLLTVCLGEFLCDRSRDHVGRTAGRIADNHAHSLRWIVASTRAWCLGPATFKLQH